MGYIIECDLKYPDKLHELYTDYPLAPKHFTVSPDMRNDLCSKIKDTNWNTRTSVLMISAQREVDRLTAIASLFGSQIRQNVNTMRDLLHSFIKSRICL